MLVPIGALHPVPDFRSHPVPPGRDEGRDSAEQSARATAPDSCQGRRHQPSGASRALCPEGTRRAPRPPRRLLGAKSERRAGSGQPPRATNRGHDRFSRNKTSAPARSLTPPLVALRKRARRRVRRTGAAKAIMRPRRPAAIGVIQMSPKRKSAPNARDVEWVCPRPAWSGTRSSSIAGPAGRGEKSRFAYSNLVMPAFGAPGPGEKKPYVRALSLHAAEAVRIASRLFDGPQ